MFSRELRTAGFDNLLWNILQGAPPRRELRARTHRQTAFGRA
ncbi:MAG: hypothetical protein WAT67_14950 [Candidatus Contendobacter sp.]